MVAGAPSVNPAGRPASAVSIAKYVASKTDGCTELIDRLLHLSRDDGTPVRERLRATQELLSRAVGQCMQPSEVAIAVAGATALVYPPGWHEFSPQARQTWLLEYRRRQLTAGGGE